MEVIRSKHLFLSKSYRKTVKKCLSDGVQNLPKKFQLQIENDISFLVMK